MKKFLTALAILACTGTLALAGPNAGGTVLVHYAPIAVPDSPQYVDGGLTACSDAVNTAPIDTPSMWFAYAAFPIGTHPRLAAVSFGCDYNIDVLVPLWTATYPGALQIFYPDQTNWPQPGTGVAIVFPQVLTETVDELYCFAGYAYQGTATFALTAHPDPTLGGNFADDGVPVQLDAIAAYGSLGFGVPGETICPPNPGACCMDDGTCVLTLEANCVGIFHPETPCEVAGCEPGFACCFPDFSCQVLTNTACLRDGGTPNTALSCDPDPCGTPTESRTWGQIKNTYR